MAGKDTEGSGDPGERVDACVLIIEARYYEDIGAELMAGALAELAARGATHEIVSVPGALEIPQVLAQAAGKFLVGGDFGDGAYDGVIALGCVIRGETSHYDIVCNNANHWLMETVTRHDVPFGNAILTVDNKEQAMARATGGRQGKGGDAVRACLRMIEVSRRFEEQADGFLFEGADADDVRLQDVELGDDGGEDRSGTASKGPRS